nr:lipopolysaccharide heptosyltransferase II [uncultured Desulfobacter sp.]
MSIIALEDNPSARVLFRAANWVGDAIMTTPVLRSVRKNYPNAQITVLAKPWVIPVYAHNPNVDHIMVYDNNGRHKRGIGTLSLAADIRQYQFDLAVLMQNAFEAALITWLGCVKERLGFNTDARGVLLNRAVKMDPKLKQGHLIDYYIAILKGAGLLTDGRKLDLYLSKEDRQTAGNILKQTGLDQSAPIIGINPGATGGTAKRWFPERFAKVAEKLSKKFNTKILIFGGSADRTLGDEISQAAPDCCINLAGKTSLGQAFALIETCRLFITNDSGLMHAAAALNINQVAVIGSTNFKATCPANENSVVIRVPVPCSPCMKPECPIDHKCMDLISVDMVYEKAIEILNG